MSANQFSWSPDYSIGNDLLDTQRKKLLGMCAQLQSLTDDQGELSAQSMRNPVLDLVNVAKLHFQTEERLLEEFGYPEIEKHLVEHSAFIAKISGMYVNTMNGDQEAHKLCEFLKTWLADHVIHSDMRLRDYFSQPPS